MAVMNILSYYFIPLDIIQNGLIYHSKHESLMRVLSFGRPYCGQSVIHSGSFATNGIARQPGEGGTAICFWLAMLLIL